MAMTPLERKAAFRAAATLHEVTMNAAARRLGVSYNHLMLVLAGPEGHSEGREGSAGLQARIAQFLGYSVDEVFPVHPGRETRAHCNSPASEVITTIWC
jgi:transcriptional regulator with XRE-family HTH domain